MGTSHRMIMTTTALQLLMVFLLNLTMAKIENENAARLQSRATTPVQNAHKYTLHKYRGMGRCVLTAMRVAEVPTMNTKLTATRSPERRRLVRKRRTGLGIDVAIKSARMVNPISKLATSVNTPSRMQYAMKPGLLSEVSFPGSKVKLSILLQT